MEGDDALVWFADEIIEVSARSRSRVETLRRALSAPCYQASGIFIA